MHAVPGDPFIGEQNIPQEILDSLYAHYGLDQPLHIQYIKYLGRLFHGDFGNSLIYEGRSINQFIREGFPISARLGAQALLIAIPAGLLLGLSSAIYRGGRRDSVAIFFSTCAISIPNFVLSSLLQLIFAIHLHWFPVARWGSFEYTILPALALAAGPTAFICAGSSCAPPTQNPEKVAELVQHFQITE